jgi:hypothetical protein
LGVAVEYYNESPLDAFRSKLYQELSTAKYLHTLKERGLNKKARRQRHKTKSIIRLGSYECWFVVLVTESFSICLFCLFMRTFFSIFIDLHLLGAIGKKAQLASAMS